MRSLMTTQRFAPLLSLVLLITMVGLGTVDLYRPAGLDAHFELIRDKVDRLPLRIGDWVGEDVEPTPGAVRLLKPNVIFQRQFVNLDSGRIVSLLVVHCGEVRDMEGHYPPICYRGHGWMLQTSSDNEILIGDQTITVRTYDFSRVDGIDASYLRVADLFVLPGGLYQDIGPVRAASRSPRRSNLGAAQIQVVCAERIPDDDWTDLIRTFLEPAKPVIDVVRGGPDGA